MSDREDKSDGPEGIAFVIEVEGDQYPLTWCSECHAFHVGFRPAAWVPPDQVCVLQRALWEEGAVPL